LHDPPLPLFAPFVHRVTSHYILAYDNGCRRFDGAIKGFGGCPMAKDELVGNMPTEKLISFCNEKKIKSNLNPLAFESAYNKAIDIF
jgi:hydroxymethylglutaryl-CoA lyase